MADAIDAQSLESARRAALADPERLGWAYALLLADRSQGLIRSGAWETPVQLLDEAQAILRRANVHTALPASATKVPVVPDHSEAAAAYLATRNRERVPAAKDAGIAHIAEGTLRAALQALPSGHPLAPLAKSRLGRSLLLHDLTLTQDLTIVEEAVVLCSAAVRDAVLPDVELLTNLGNALRARFELTGSRADLTGAITSLQRALELGEPTQLSEHAILADLGSALLVGFAATDDTSYLDEAVATQHQALTLLSPNHRDRSAVQSNLGAALLTRFERYAAAEDLEDAVGYLSAAWEGGGGRQDMVRTNLAAALLTRYGLTGTVENLDAALNHLAAAVEDAPPGSAQRMSTQTMLAQALCEAGRLRPARDLLSEVVLEREAIFGNAHTSTLAARHNLATVMARLGHCKEAVGEFQEVLSSRRQVLGAQHPDTLTSQHNLALALADLGQTDKAHSEFEAVVVARRAVLGPGHPDTRASESALAELELL